MMHGTTNIKYQQLVFYGKGHRLTCCLRNVQPFSLHTQSLGVHGGADG